MCAYIEQLAHFLASVERADTITASFRPWLCHTYYVTLCTGTQQQLLQLHLRCYHSQRVYCLTVLCFRGLPQRRLAVAAVEV
jgi:hypothetical protein